MLELEAALFGQVVRSKIGEGYQVIRPWDGSSVFVASLVQERARMQLQYNDKRDVVLSYSGEVF